MTCPGFLYHTLVRIPALGSVLQGKTRFPLDSLPQNAELEAVGISQSSGFSFHRALVHQSSLTPWSSPNQKRLCLLRVKEVEVWWVLMEGEAGAYQSKKEGLHSRAELGGLQGERSHTRSPGASTARLGFIRAKLVLII